ncbi:RHS repeat-associated core domain-containing protein [Pokkaliibacter sp. CJK22405]|uniref:RHS repeat-associated core domain-containing protein n=1 Tax=Pokkaliibacter sp. CJK22405 TaxID=3384615 RepID=UPI0039848561
MSFFPDDKNTFKNYVEKSNQEKNRGAGYASISFDPVDYTSYVVSSDKQGGCWGVSSNPMQTGPSSAVFKNVASVAGTDSATALPVGAMTLAGDPVSLVTGEEILSLTDFNLPGLFPLEWKRTYRTALCTQDIGLGKGWLTPFHQYVQLIQGDSDSRQLVFVDHDGRQHLFGWVGAGGISYQQAAGLALEHLYDDSEERSYFRLFLPNGQSWDFTCLEDGSDRFLLTRLCSPQGHMLYCRYDDQFRLHLLDYTYGKAVEVQYDEHNRITALQAVRMSSHQIAEHHQVLARYSYSDRGDLLTATDAFERTENYRYEQGLLIQRRRASGFSHFFRWDYDGANPVAARCVEQWGDRDIYHYHFEYDRANRITTMTDSRGGRFIYTHNEQWMPVRIETPSGAVTLKDYDEQLRVIREIDPLGRQTLHRYSPQGLLLETRHADGHSELFDYNERGQLVAHQDSEGLRIKREFNSLGKLLWEENADGLRTDYLYDERGRLYQVESDHQPTLTYLYEKQQPDRLAAVRIGEAQWRYGYDEQGHINAILNPDQRITTLRYERGLVVERAEFPQATPDERLVTRYEYNEAGQLTRQTDPDGKITQMEYDGLSQPVAQQLPDGSRLTLEYDQERNLTAIQRNDGSRYLLDYDGEERISRTQGFDGREQHYRYDAAGQLLALSEQERRITLERDLAGKVTRRIATLNDQQQEDHFTPRLRQGSSQLENPHARWNYSYSPAGQLRNATLTSPFLSEAQRFEQEFNAQGQIISQQLPDGSRWNFSYESHQLASVQWQAAGALEPKTILERSLDEQLREVKRQCGELSLTSFYDAQGRLKEQQRQIGEKQQSRRYYYGADQQLTSVEDSELGDQRYQYDALAQLVEHHQALVDAPKGAFNTARFAFDSQGNPLHRDAESTFDRLTHFGALRYSYDAYGNQTTVRQADSDTPLQTREFDALNQLSSLSTGDIRVRYFYDSLGRRIAKQVETRQLVREDGYDEEDDDAWVTRIDRATTVFFWDDQRLIGEVTDDQYRWYLYEPKTFRPLALVDQGQVYTYQLDQLGTPQRLCDLAGRTVWLASYSAFGEAHISLEEVSNPLRFQGQYFDAESGLHYNRYRYYDPQTGRYISQDPIGLLGGLNPYRYTPNPINWVDPLGLSCKEGLYEEISDSTHYFYKKLMSTTTVPDLASEFDDEKKWPPLSPPNAHIDQNIDEAKSHWSPFWFRNQVKNKGPWDYKQQGSKYEDFGNFNYGATGAAFGFPSSILLNEAGLAQEAAGTSQPDWGKSGTLHLPFLGEPPYKDDPNDQYWIKQGIDYYEHPERWHHENE